MTLQSITTLFNPQTWALIALVLALSCVMLGIMVLLGWRSRTQTTHLTEAQSDRIYGQDEAIAATLQATDAMAFHAELLDELSESLKTFIEALDTAPLEPVVETSLDEVSQQLDQAHSILNTLSHQLATQHADHLNRQGASIKDQAPPDSAGASSKEITQSLEELRALDRALTGISRAHYHNTQWHDQPAALRHQDSLARLQALKREIDGLFNTLHQSNEALDQTKKALDAMSTQNARRP